MWIGRGLGALGSVLVKKMVFGEVRKVIGFKCLNWDLLVLGLGGLKLMDRLVDKLLLKK